MTGADDRERRALTEVERLLDLDANARAAALALLAQEDAGLADAVRRLLARDVNAATWLPTESPGLWAAVEDRIPERIGPFAIAGVLGKGGMGVVLRGVRDDGLFNQVVAIKLMRANLLSIHQQERFILERRILARLDSPAVCRILDGGVWEGRPFLVMEYVEGRPLTVYADAQSLDLAARLRLFLAVCEVVRYAHRQLIVHADLKPSNIMVSAEGRVKLLDFGVARMIDNDPEMQDSGTSASNSLTRAYAAPERKRGDRPSIEADVFSLGAILFELLTGRIGAPDGNERWPLASSVDGAPFKRPALHGDLDAIIAKAVEVDPADRYPDVAALIADIEAWFDHYPVSARQDDWRMRTAKFVARHRRGLITAILAGLVLTGAAIFSEVQAIRADRARAVAERRFDDVRALSNYMLFDLYDRLATRPGTVALRAQIAENSTRYLSNLQLSDDAPADLRLDVARSYRRLAEIQGYPSTSNLGQPDHALRSLDRAEAILTRMRPDQPGYGDVLTELGWVHADRWALSPDVEGETALIASARTAFSAALVRSPGDKLAQLGLLSLQRAEAYHLIWASDRPAAAIPVVRRALARLRETQWPAALAERRDGLEVALLNQWGDAIYYAGDIPGSLVPYREADALIDRQIAARGSTPSLLIAKAFEAFNLSGSMSDIAGRKEEALKKAQAGAVAMEGLLAAGPDSNAEKILLILYGQEAVALESLGRIPEALVPLQRGLAIRERRLAAIPDEAQRIRDLAIGLAQQARLLGLARRVGEACAVATRGLALWRTLKIRGQLSRHDADKEVPQSRNLSAKYCL